jgi:hypothetical protein
MLSTALSVRRVRGSRPDGSPQEPDFVDFVVTKCMKYDEIQVVAHILKITWIQGYF